MLKKWDLNFNAFLDYSLLNKVWEEKPREYSQKYQDSLNIFNNALESSQFQSYMEIDTENIRDNIYKIMTISMFMTIFSTKLTRKNVIDEINKRLKVLSFGVFELKNKEEESSIFLKFGEVEVFSHRYAHKYKNYTPIQFIRLIFEQLEKSLGYDNYPDSEYYWKNKRATFPEKLIYIKYVHAIAKQILINKDKECLYELDLFPDVNELGRDNRDIHDSKKEIVHLYVSEEQLDKWIKKDNIYQRTEKQLENGFILNALEIQKLNAPALFSLKFNDEGDCVENEHAYRLEEIKYGGNSYYVEKFDNNSFSNSFVNQRNNLSSRRDLKFIYNTATKLPAVLSKTEENAIYSKLNMKCSI